MKDWEMGLVNKKKIISKIIKIMKLNEFGN